MSIGIYSFEASVFENGKIKKGTLFIFDDEFSFGSLRKSVNWEDVTLNKGQVIVKSFLVSSPKDCVSISENGYTSPQFIMESRTIADLISTVESISDSHKKIRLDNERKEKEARAVIEAREMVADKERRKESTQKLEIEEKPIRKTADYERIVQEKNNRIKAMIESANKTCGECIELPAIAVKAGDIFLNNPYRILGISCLSSTEEANNALDKLKKLSRLKALEAFTSAFDLSGIRKPDRDLSIAQNSLAMLKNNEYKWLWFATADACTLWNNGKYRIELAKDGLEFGSYDLFVANYMYGVFCDSNFCVPETWKRILNYYCYLCNSTNESILRSRFNEEELRKLGDTSLLTQFKKTVFKPMLMLCDRDDLDSVLRLLKIVKEVNDTNGSVIDDLYRLIIGKLVTWFTDKEENILSFLREYADVDSLSEDDVNKIFERGNAYCHVVEPVFETVLRDFRGDIVRYDMIKESYRSVTYQLMYVLHKYEDKTKAIVFANRCYSYCKSDDKKRIKNTFGDVNIKAIDWNNPHTIWDIKGDNYYFGRGCKVDYAQALNWYHQAANAGNMYSQNSIGVCYQNGHGVPQDYELAFKWFEKACDSGSPDGAYNLAECYINGQGVEKNIDMALKCLSRAVELGHTGAEAKRKELFSKVISERKQHRANNHILIDIGFQMTVGPNVYVEVTLNHPANVYLVNSQGYQNYMNGDDFSHKGGYTSNDVYRINIPSSNRWYVIVDNGDNLLGDLKATAKVKTK